MTIFFKANFVNLTFLKKSIYFMCLLACLYVQYTHLVAEEAGRTGVTDSCELSDVGSLECNSGPLEEQYVRACS